MAVNPRNIVQHQQDFPLFRKSKVSKGICVSQHCNSGIKQLDKRAKQVSSFTLHTTLDTYSLLGTIDQPSACGTPSATAMIAVV